MKLFGYQITKIRPLLSENKKAIEWAEAIVLNSNYKGEVSRESFMPDWFLSDKRPTEEQVKEWQNDKARQFRNQIMSSLGATNKGYFDLDIITKELIKYLEMVKKFLLHEGYIEEPRVVETFWRLTARGRKMKELGTHKKYLSWKYSVTHSHQIQFIINLGLILATALAAFMPFVVAHFYPPKITVNLPPQNQQLTHNDSVLLHQFVLDEIKYIKPIPKPTKTIKTKLPKKGGG